MGRFRCKHRGAVFLFESLQFTIIDLLHRVPFKNLKTSPPRIHPFAGINLNLRYPVETDLFD